MHLMGLLMCWLRVENCLPMATSLTASTSAIRVYPPIYADRSLLPQKLRFVGAEYDVLCNEAHETAKLYSEHEKGEKEQGDIAEDKKQGVQSWRKGNVWWEMVLDAQHGFNYVTKKEPEAEKERKRVTALAYERACAWLKAEVYA